MNTKILETVEGESRGKSGSSHYKVTKVQELHEKYGLPYQATSYQMLLEQSMASGVGIHAVRLTNDVFLFGYADNESMFFDLEEIRKDYLTIN